MYVDVRVPNRVSFRMVLPRSQVDRLYGTCFRGGDSFLERARAGNFAAWDSFHDLVDDGLVQQMLADQMDNRFGTADALPQNGQVRFTVSLPFNIGWSSTIDRHEGDFADWELKQFKVNKQTWADQVASEDSAFAPATRQITFAGRVLIDQGGLVFIVGTIYPGADIGPLKPTRRSTKGNGRIEKVIFFDWDHRGEYDPLERWIVHFPDYVDPAEAMFEEFQLQTRHNDGL